jgi:hypothetical protein
VNLPIKAEATENRLLRLLFFLQEILEMLGDGLSARLIV